MFLGYDHSAPFKDQLFPKVEARANGQWVPVPRFWRLLGSPAPVGDGECFRGVRIGICAPLSATSAPLSATSGSRGSFARATLRISVRPAPPRCGLFTASFLTACARQGLIVQGNSVVGAAVAYAMDLVYVAARMGAAGAGCGLLGAVFFLDQEALAGSLQGHTRTRV